MAHPSFSGRAAGSAAAAKSRPFESGVSTGAYEPSRFSISYYLTAMLFIVFDIEIVFLYPLAVQLRQLALFGFMELLVFVAAARHRLRLHLAQGGTRMEVIPPGRPHAALRATDIERVVMTTTVEKVINWAASNSMWPFGFGLACCAMEMIAMLTPRYDIGRFGSEIIRATPRQSDLLIVSGRVSHRMAAPIRELYEQMLEPKWVMAMGACSSTGGMFANYAILQGVDKIIPVDIYVPGCPPRPEAVIEGVMNIQKKIQAGIPPAYEQQKSQA